ncbi:toll-like receptor 3 [Toxorhynchites rutilus septentrionalis]|uniref:toll-like receptor 3 n=1 Tax=Toxorhynchites rutilus septentrionalis TaxID=329112 RepID=UPI002478BCF4|nr:toll-like receptor 3 [Toxorhynchites rutilus septentrionalis]
MMHKWLQLCCLCVIATFTSAHNYNTRHNQSPSTTEKQYNYGTSTPTSNYQQSNNNVTEGTPANSDTGYSTVQDPSRTSTTDLQLQQPDANVAVHGKQINADGTASNTQGTQSNPVSSNPPVQNPSRERHICTIVIHPFDCGITNVKLRKGEQADFGLGWERNRQKKITFENSILQYLPKNLIDAFPSLQLLKLEDLQITEIEPHAFQNANKLSILLLQNNQLGEIARGSFEGANQLTYMSLSNNDITYMDDNTFNRAISLKSLWLDGNKIERLPNFGTNVGLESVNASYNSLNSIPDNHFAYNSQLKKIDVSHNQLTQFDLWQLNNKASLNTIDVSFNGLTRLYIPRYAQIINARNNSIERVTVEQCGLQHLSLASNRIKVMPNLGRCTQLMSLDLSDNLLEEFSHATLANARQLEYLNLAHNHLFQINLPGGQAPLSWKHLDLSNNYLSYGPKVLKSLAQLDVLLLNNNRFISFDFDGLQNIQALFISHNEWNCNSVSAVIHKVADPNTHQCSPGFKNLRGVCCKDYVNPYNDRFNEILRDIHLSEVNQRDSLKQQCSSSQNNPQQYAIESHKIDGIRAEAASADASKRDILNKIALVEDNRARLNEQNRNAEEQRRLLGNHQVGLSKEIEKQREMYGITKEGLISDKWMLEKIIKFVESRMVFQNELLSTRRNTFAETAQQIEALNTEKTNLETSLNKLKQDTESLKQNEKKLKTEKDTLERQLNRNSASIHGTSGRVTK